MLLTLDLAMAAIGLVFWFGVGGILGCAIGGVLIGLACAFTGRVT